MWVAHAREEARRETFDRLAHELTDQRCAALGWLLVTEPSIGSTRLRWISTGPVEVSAAAVKAEVGKLEFLRCLGAHVLDLSVLPAASRWQEGAVRVLKGGHSGLLIMGFRLLMPTESQLEADPFLDRSGPTLVQTLPPGCGRALHKRRVSQ